MTAQQDRRLIIGFDGSVLGPAALWTHPVGVFTFDAETWSAFAHEVAERAAERIHARGLTEAPIDSHWWPDADKVSFEREIDSIDAEIAAAAARIAAGEPPPDRERPTTSVEQHVVSGPVQVYMAPHGADLDDPSMWTQVNGVATVDLEAWRPHTARIIETTTAVPDSEFMRAYIDRWANAIGGHPIFTEHTTEDPE